MTTRKRVKVDCTVTVHCTQSSRNSYPLILLRWRVRVHACRYLQNNQLFGPLPNEIGSPTALTNLCVWLHLLRVGSLERVRTVCWHVVAQLCGA